MKTNNLSPEFLVSIPSRRSEAPITTKIRNVYHDPLYPEDDAIMDWYGNVVEAKDVNPIVITDDFWEKNNFTMIGKTQVVLNGDPGVHFEKTFSSDEYFSAHILSYSIPVKYIHQLQRIFKILGKNIGFII